MPSFQEAKEKILELVDSYTGLTMQQISESIPEEMKLFDIPELVKGMVESGAIKEHDLLPESPNGWVVYVTPSRHFT